MSKSVFSLLPSILNSSATVINTTSTAVNSNAIVSLHCSGYPAPGTVPDNDNYSGIPLTITKSAANLILSWSAPGSTCTTQDYGIYRGTLPWTAYNHSFIVCTTSGLTTATITASTSSYYYLIVAQSGAKEGSYGLDSLPMHRDLQLRHHVFLSK